MMRRIEAFSIDDNVAHQVRLFANGAQVGDTFAATAIGANTYAYYFDVPAATVAGRYTFALYRTSTNALRSQGELHFDGQRVVSTYRPVMD